MPRVAGWRSSSQRRPEALPSKSRRTRYWSIAAALSAAIRGAPAQTLNPQARAEEPAGVRGYPRDSLRVRRVVDERRRRGPSVGPASLLPASLAPISPAPRGSRLGTVPLFAPPPRDFGECIRRGHGARPHLQSR